MEDEMQADIKFGKKTTLLELTSDTLDALKSKFPEL
jgi:hypothetical protein